MCKWRIFFELTKVFESTNVPHCELYISLCWQYGGDITRKMKLLKKQAEGKKKMRLIGRVEVPKDTFINVLKRKDK